jgi:hypothetical protein
MKHMHVTNPEFVSKRDGMELVMHDASVVFALCASASGSSDVSILNARIRTDPSLLSSSPHLPITDMDMRNSGKADDSNQTPRF